jgi:hypothetical protein
LTGVVRPITRTTCGKSATLRSRLRLPW